MGKYIGAIFVMILLAGLALPAHALKRNDELITPESMGDPKRQVGDLVLPMPKSDLIKDDLVMVLRPVEIKATLLLDDYKFPMGLSKTGDKSGYYEKQRDAYISAPFRLTDLPASWQAEIKKLDEERSKDLSPAEKEALAKNKDSDKVYYFIGKYEITNGQWDAVMNSETSSGPGNKPKTDVSWFDLQNFLNKYNEWLLNEHSDKIPAIDGRPGFLRLPTETEWEFAAKGGMLIPTSVLENNDFIGDKAIKDYAVYGSDMMPIASRSPNILGLYDMSGNAAELVQSGLRFTVADQNANGVAYRTHGSEGGLLRKGGSHLKADEEEMYPGRRVEVRMYEKGENGYVAHKENDLGARLVMTSVNMPSPNRLTQLANDEKQEGRGKGTASAPKVAPKPAAEGQKEGHVRINTAGDPLEELEKIYVVTQSPMIKSNLDQYRTLIKDRNEAFRRANDENLRNAILSAAYMEDSLANIAFRVFEVDNAMQRLKELKELTKEREKKYTASREEHFRNLINSTQLYRSSVRNLSQYSKEELDDKIGLLISQYQGKDKLNANMRNNLLNFGKHVEIFKMKGMDGLPDQTIWDQVIPNEKMRSLLKTLAKNSKKS